MKRIAAALLILCLALPLFAVSDYSVESMIVDIDVQKNGLMNILEEMEFSFSRPRHGFYRTIPTSFPEAGRTAKVYDIQSSSEIYDIDEDSGRTVIQIGDPDRYVEGEVPYAISYTYDLTRDMYDDYDEVYLNITGPDWECPIYNIAFRITFPEEISSDMIWMTTGPFGSQGNEIGTWKMMDDRTIVGYADHAYPGEAVTIRVQLPEGYFVGQRELRNWSIIWLVTDIVYTAAMVLIIIMLYRKYGVDMEPVIVPQFSAPDGFTPMDVGYIADGSVDTKDITSMIFYWADKGLLNIIEDRKDRFTLEKVREPEYGKESELLMFRSLFGDRTTVTMEDIVENRFAEKIPSIITAEKNFFTKEKALKSRKSSTISNLSVLFLFPSIILATASVDSRFDIAGNIMMCIVTILFSVITGCIMYGLFRNYYTKRRRYLVALVINSIAATLIIAADYWLFSDTSFIVALLEAMLQALAILTPVIGSCAIEKRSDYGQKKLEEVLGFRDYIETVEKDRLVTMVDQDPQYFYRILSYAAVFGLEKKWAKKFDGITVEQPSWYYGSPAGDYMFYSIMFSRYRTSYAGVVTSKSTSGTGAATSFGSSGFSGGGFGGGGGGAW